MLSIYYNNGQKQGSGNMRTNTKIHAAWIQTHWLSLAHITQPPGLRFGVASPPGECLPQPPPYLQRGRVVFTLSRAPSTAVTVCSLSVSPPPRALRAPPPGLICPAFCLAYSSDELAFYLVPLFFDSALFSSQSLFPPGLSVHLSTTCIAAVSVRSEWPSPCGPSALRSHYLLDISPVVSPAPHTHCKSDTNTFCPAANSGNQFSLLYQLCLKPVFTLLLSQTSSQTTTQGLLGFHFSRGGLLSPFLLSPLAPPRLEPPHLMLPHEALTVLVTWSPALLHPPCKPLPE